MKTNQDLKLANLPRFDFRTHFTFTGEGTPDPKDIEAMNNYFQHFVPPGPCIKCGHQQGVTGPTDIVGILTGKARFKWGMVNGEGNCSTGGCGWPARAIHRNIGPIKELQMILQYHPDIVEFKELGD